MPFGVDTGISRNTNNSVNVAEKLTENGDVNDMHTYGGKTEKTAEYYSSSYTNEATNGQEGTTGIISAHNLIEQNTDYAREQKTTVDALATQA